MSKEKVSIRYNTETFDYELVIGDCVSVIEAWEVPSVYKFITERIVEVDEYTKNNIRGIK